MSYPEECRGKAGLRAHSTGLGPLRNAILAAGDALVTRLALTLVLRQIAQANCHAVVHLGMPECAARAATGVKTSRAATAGLDGFGDFHCQVETDLLDFIQLLYVAAHNNRQIVVVEIFLA